MNPCFVIGGGTSLKGFDFSLLKGQKTIVSNKAIFDVPNPSYFVTCDYTFLNYMKLKGTYKKWKNLSCKKIFVANCIAPYIQVVGKQITDTRSNLKYQLNDFDKIIICESAKSVGFTFEDFNSGYNSGFSGFQLALILGFNPIYLLGMDMYSSTATHYHGGYGKSKQRFDQNLENYLPHFVSVLKELKNTKPYIKIYSCSKTSKLNKFIPYKNIEDIL